MTTYRCAACGSDLETEKVRELNIIEVKPCEACVDAAEEAGYDKAMREVETEEEADDD